MRNRALTLAAALVFSTVQLACSGSSPTDASANPTDPSDGAPSGTPSQNLASANAGAAPSADDTTSSPFGTGNHEVPYAGTAASSGGSSGGSGSTSGGSTSGGSTSGGSTSGGTVDPNAGAGPKPTASCSVSKSTFFTRTSSQSDYVAYVPSSYDGTKPMRLIVALHGCGDSAANFAQWGPNPYDTRSTQDWIGISVGGADGRCWNASDDVKVLAAVDDISQCLWVHQKKIVLAGFSSGGELTYRLGLGQSSRFAGLLIEDSGLYAANGNPDGLLASAAWKINIAHRAHTSDTVFPLGTVQADWAKTTAAGFPLTTSVVAGTHDGTSTDWSSWLLPQSAAWTAP
jgi:predicted esterase